MILYTEIQFTSFIFKVQHCQVDILTARQLMLYLSVRVSFLASIFRFYHSLLTRVQEMFR